MRKTDANCWTKTGNYLWFGGRGNQTGQAFIELPLGEGDVPFRDYLAALEEIGYEGYLTIEREVGDQPEADIRTAVNYLKQLMAK